MGNIKWIDIYSAKDENRILKQHAYVDDGEGGNISLCGKMIIGVDWGAEKFIDLIGENKRKNFCKICDKKSLSSLKYLEEEISEVEDYLLITKFVLSHALNRKTFSTIYFEVNKHYNIYNCSQVYVRSKETNQHLYVLNHGPWIVGGACVVKLFKLSQSGKKKELFSMESSELIKLINNEKGKVTNSLHHIKKF